MLFVLSLVLFLDSVYNLVRYFYSNRLFSSQSLFSNVENRFVILAPVLYEEDNIGRFYESLTNLSYQNYEICFITSEKEYARNKIENTITILQGFAPRDNILIIHSQDKEGNRITQLNKAYDHYQKKEMDLNKVHFVVLDADGIIPQDLLKVINNQIEKDVEYYQIPHLWFRNYPAISSILMKGFCYLQTYKVLSEEVPKISGWFFPWRAKYFVGNGMVIRGSLLKKVSGFKDFIEDVRLGHICSFLGIKSKVIPFFTLTETAPRYAILLKQTSNWFFGCNLFLSDYKEAKKINPRITYYKCAFKLFSILYENIRWMLKNPLIVFLVLYGLYANNTVILVLSTCSYLCSSLIPAVLINSYQKDYISTYVNFPFSERVKGVFGTILIFPIYSLGTFGGAFKLAKYYLFKKVDIYKTERT